MKTKLVLFTFVLMTNLLTGQGGNEDPLFANSMDLMIERTSVVFDERLQQLIFSIETKGTAGQTVPKAIGGLNGAPVLGYVFPTTLNPESVGFSRTDGILALALTSHPDFDDTPLWDEDNDHNYENDGVIWHPHWVVLTQDTRVEGGLSVKQFTPGTDNVTLPPTNPGMPMYMDSPGYSIVTKDNVIRVVVPAFRLSNNTQFNYDAVSAYMEVNTTNPDYPMLGVYSVYSIASEDLSLPFSVSQ